MMKNQKGITLIALVITIIVLLILAGVSIAMLRGDNGVLTNASEAQRSTIEKQAIEEINIALNSIKTQVLAEKIKSATYNQTGETEMGKLKEPAVTGISADETEYTAEIKSTKIEITYKNEALDITVVGSIDLSKENGGLIDAAKVQP